MVRIGINGRGLSLTVEDDNAESDGGSLDFEVSRLSQVKIRADLFQQ